MHEYFKIARRNLFRNKRRSLITISSIFFGVFFAIMMKSMMIGSFGNMIDNIVKSYSGYIQIQNPDYFNNKTINNTFEANPALMDTLSKLPYISSYTQRLESFALAATETKSRGIFIVGIEAQREEKIMKISKRIVKGSYLKKSETGKILIGSDIAKYMKLSVGDSLVLIGQGYHGMSAAGIFKIKGIVEFPSPGLNGKIAFVNLKDSQDFNSAPNRLSSIVIMINNYDKVISVSKKLKKAIPNKYSILTWMDMQPELVQLIDGKMGSNALISYLLFLIIGFGILGTVIMMVAERKRELGVMIALGMKKSKLMIILYIEVLLLGFWGIFSGFIVTYPICLYFELNPIHLTGETAKLMAEKGFEPLYVFSTKAEVFINPAIIIFCLVTIISLYAIWYIAKIKVVNALKA